MAPSESGGSYTLVWGTDGALLALFTPTGHGFCSCERPATPAAAASNPSASGLFAAHERSRARFVATARDCALYRADGSLAQRFRWAPPPQRLPGTILLPVCVRVLYKVYMYTVHFTLKHGNEALQIFYAN